MAAPCWGCLPRDSRAGPSCAVPSHPGVCAVLTQPSFKLRHASIYISLVHAVPHDCNLTLHSSEIHNFCLFVLRGCFVFCLYKFRDLTIEELKDVSKTYPNFMFSMNTYTFKDGSQKDLLNFSGTVPVKYAGNSYNIPVRLWILDSHPFAPPICFLKPTANMGIAVGKHVDARGRIYLPYLQNWSHPKSTVIGLIKEMIAKFEEELPLYSLSSSDAARQSELLSYIAKITEGETDMKSRSKTGSRNEGCFNKITVVGAGDLGIACVLAVAAKDIADKVVLLDLSEGAAKGGTMDLEIFAVPDVEISKDFSASADSKVVVLTVNSLGNAQTYLDVIQSNVDLFRGIIPAVSHYSQNAILLVASHPALSRTLFFLYCYKIKENNVLCFG
ncbi:ubiquitin-conjugating enzyme E2 variant 3 isoform X5 [Passer montanus]|uniref:ubiquitin-conjugating enzyme E2 variant 3 isoform X5 n=1 Tax=Passer montanus TaxID=9160 RepID=UPI00195F490B|nr:ubiquitin-conjugating enzyme E2 variant 3 isoform X5 [Passer montanus]